MSIEVRPIRPEEREECVDLWCAVFGDDRRYFNRYFYGDVDWIPEYTQVAVADGRLVSAVHVCKRIVACGPLRLTMGGIANVATLPDYRGRGLNTRCLDACIAVMEADAMDFSLLFTGIDAYYARRGYSSLQRDVLTGRVCRNGAAPHSEVAVRAAEASDTNAIREIYAAYNRDRPIAVQRTDAYWRDWIGFTSDRAPENVVCALNASGTVAGYLRYWLSRGYGKPGIIVSELGVASSDGAAAIVASMLRAVAAREPECGEVTVTIKAPIEPEVENGATCALRGLQRLSDGHGMARLLHPDNLLRSFCLEWNDIWIRAGRPRGAVTFVTPYGYIGLDAHGDFLRVTKPGSAASAHAQGTLFGLLFGDIDPESVMQAADIRPLLETLFPRRATIYWDSDGF